MSFEQEMLSACRADLALEKRNLRVLKRLSDPPEATPKAKEVLQGLVWNWELKLKNREKFIEYKMHRVTIRS